MDGLRQSLRLLAVCGFLSGSALAQGTATEAPSAKLLKFRPSLPGVDYDTPPDEATRNACKVEPVITAEKRNIGYALRDPQGKMLRRFVSARGKKMDQWSYYQDGFEVYREDDLNGDSHLDECRWLNSGGSRIALVERGKIKAWKQISAEEASKVMVQALVAGDAALLETVMASPEELADAGVPKDVVAKVAASAEKRVEQIAALQKQLVGWNAQTIWNRFDGTFPHVIPADPARRAGQGLDALRKRDGDPGHHGRAAEQRQDGVLAGFRHDPARLDLEIHRASACHRSGEADRRGREQHAIDAVRPGRATIAPRNEAMELRAQGACRLRRRRMPRRLQAGEKRSIARYHVSRIPLLRAIVKESANDDEKLGYNKQVVDSLIAAFRTGHYPQGRKPLETIIKEGGKLAPYAAYSLIDADFAIRNDEPGANFVANQKKWMAELEEFLEKFSDSDEAAPVLFHLANANEFNADEAKAREQYARLVKNYAGTEAGKKAAGALRRLDLAGKELSIAGTGLQNDTVDTSKYRGKPVLGRVLGKLGDAGEARPSRAGEAVREAPKDEARDHRNQSRQRSSRAGRLRERAPDHLAADLTRPAGWTAAWRWTTASSSCPRCFWSIPRGRWSIAICEPRPKSTASSKRWPLASRPAWRLTRRTEHAQIAQAVGIKKAEILALADEFEARGIGVIEGRKDRSRSPTRADAGIEKNPGVCGGAARIAGTRIPVWQLVEARALGASEAEILVDFPSLPRSGPGQRVVLRGISSR